MAEMNLDEAYEIAGGYKKVDDATFKKALAMVREDDPWYADAFEEAYNIELNKEREQNIQDRFTPKVNDIASNTTFLDSEFKNRDIKGELLADKEVKEALDNTPIIETACETPYELEGEEREKHINMLVEKTRLDVACELIEDVSFARETDTTKRKNTFFDRLKTSFLGTLATLRLTSQLEANVPNSAEAIKNEDKNERQEFFDEQLDALANMQPQDEACNFGKKIGISVDSVVASCTETDHKANKLVNKFNGICQTVNGASKKYYQEAANFIYKAKTSFAEKAKELWGQRYEFMYNLKDNAPKIITDVSATVGLIGLSVANSPWVGTAAIAYGAYKAASSWMWPIVKKARKDARLANNDENAPKVSFWQRLKNASNSIFNDKEERKQYVKEAGWGTAAGLVGLGAAGAVMSGAVTIGSQVAGATTGVVARSFQSLSALAVHSVNNTLNTIRTVKSKKTDGWTKAFAIGGTFLAGYILYKCGSNADDLVSSTTDLNEDKLVAAGKVGATDNSIEIAPVNSVTKPGDAVPFDADSTYSAVNHSSDTIMATSQGDASQTPNQAVAYNASVVEDVDVANSVSVPTEWNENMGISKSWWNRLQTYWEDNPENYNKYYAKITDDMLGEGGIFEGLTREEALFKYERLSTWNLIDHRDTLEKLDSFFRDCNDGNFNISDIFNENDKNVLNSVMDDGSINGVVGDKCIQVTGRFGLECGDESTLRTISTGDCGCNEEIIEDVNVEETSEDIVSDNIFVEQAPTETFHDEELKVSLNKGNNLSFGEKVADVDASDADLHSQNRDIMFEESSNSSEVSSESSLFEEREATETFSNDTGAKDSSETDVVFEEREATETFSNNTGAKASGETAVVFEERETTETFSNDTGAKASGETDVVFEERETTETFSNDTTAGGNPLELEAENVEVEDTGAETEASNDVVTKSEIIEGTENVEEGTPAAGNIDARGGYENSGITEEQYDRMQSFFRNQYGENAYEEFSARITDEMRAKGGIFEGLSVEQSMFSVQQMIAWSNDQTGEFADEITNMVNYLKDCDDIIIDTDAQNIKAVIDAVNENGTIDGVTGTKPVVVRYFQANDCGEAGTYGIENGASGRTDPSGDAFNRFFKRTWTETPTPIFEEQAPTETIHVEELSVSLNKGNNLTFGEKVADVDAKDAVINARNRNIRIEVKENSR